MNGILVSNTGPIIALALMDRLGILRSLFTSVIVPEAVHDEILRGGATNAGVATYVQSPWICVKQPSKARDPLLFNVLDVGEASVIQLACEMKADCVLIDERKARKIARGIYGLRVIGTARVLVEAKEKGLVANVGDTLSLMRRNGYWVDDEIVAASMKAAGEA